MLVLQHVGDQDDGDGDNDQNGGVGDGDQDEGHFGSNLLRDRND